jgi:membrane fusion protein (multidrug efflux system)
MSESKSVAVQLDMSWQREFPVAQSEGTELLKVEPQRPFSDAMLVPAAFRDLAVLKPAPRRFTVRALLLLVAVLLLMAGAAGYGWYYWTVGQFLESTDDAYVQADSTIVAPKVSGYLREVRVSDNQPVKAGQLLATIDDRDYVVAVDQAKADVAAAQADIDNLKASLDQQQAVIAQARDTVTLDQANLTYAQQENDRYTTLAKGGGGSVELAQQAISRLDTARATLEHDTAAVQAAEKQVNVLQAELAKADATLQHNQAVEQQAELNLGYTRIVAPIEGVVGNRSLRVGEYVQAGTQLMALVPLDAVYIVANFEETQLADIRRGQLATIGVDSFPGTTFTGRVDSLAPASGAEFTLLPPDNATGNFTKIVQRIPVKIVLDPDNPLAGDVRPGMSVVATIDTRQHAPVGAAPSMVPSAAAPASAPARSN